jgi:hypothetical protein
VALAKYLDSASTGGVEKCVDPRHFHAAPSQLGGMGLFCGLDLEPGDIWFLQNSADSRYFLETIKVDVDVESISREWLERNGIDPILDYYDFRVNGIVKITEPFCRVNHSILNRNSCEDEAGNDCIACHLPAGKEILTPYTFDAVFSLAWKFRGFKQMLTNAGYWENDYLRMPVNESKLAMDFLATM